MPSGEKVTYSKRERQIMDIVFRQRQATAAEIHEQLPNPPSYTAVRGLLRVLVDKGHLEIESDGVRYLYRPTTSRDKAGASQLSHVVKTFFDGSAAQAMAALLGSPDVRLSDADLERLAGIVERARAEESVEESPVGHRKERKR